MSSELDSPSAKKAKLSPSPPPSTSWTPSVAPDQEVESCDSGLSDSGVTTPPVTEDPEEASETGPRSAAEVEDDDDSLSGFSDLSGQDWKPDMSSKLTWLHAAMRRGENPRDILETLLPSGSEIPDSLDNMTMWKILFNLLSEPPRRKKLEGVSTLEDCVSLIRNSSNIIVLTGAGVSVSCGIPDFRSRDGVYARLAVDFPDLPDPQAMFDIQYFKKDPRPFFKFAREIYPGQFQPSPCHKFIRCVETSGKLLRNYTQNIDTLEQVAGIQNVIQCHGSFATASCMVCKRKVDADVIREDIFNQTTPKCGQCPEPAPAPELPELDTVGPMFAPEPAQLPVMKPDIVFFGEGLPDHFHECISRDKTSCDLLIVIGSSLKVRPVALIPSSLPPNVPQILINREPLPHLTFDVELLGDCDRIVNQLCLLLGGDTWTPPIHRPLLAQHTGRPLPSHQQGDAASCAEEGRGPGSGSEVVSNSVDGNVQNDHPALVDNLTTENSTAEIDQDQAEDNQNNEVSDDEEDWKMKSLADQIPDGQFLYLPPSRYIFPGAEIYPDSSDDEEDDDLEDNDRNEEDEEDRDGEHEIVSDPSAAEDCEVSHDDQPRELREAEVDSEKEKTM